MLKRICLQEWQNTAKPKVNLLYKIFNFKQLLKRIHVC